MKTIKTNHIILAFLFLMLLTSLNTCIGCQSKNSSKKLLKENDSLQTEIAVLQSKIESLNNTTASLIDIRIEGLKTEKRMLINTNQIFLSKLRPDERVLEIDKEIEKLEKENSNNESK